MDGRKLLVSLAAVALIALIWPRTSWAQTPSCTESVSSPTVTWDCGGANKYIIYGKVYDNTGTDIGMGICVFTWTNVMGGRLKGSTAYDFEFASSASITWFKTYAGDEDDVVRPASAAGESCTYGGETYTLKGQNYSGDGYQFHGEAGDDWIFLSSICDAGTAVAGGQAYGEGDDDSICGTPYNDWYLYGGDGTDRIWAGDGEDYLFGGEGNDHLYGEQGCDHLNGQGGASDYCICWDTTEGLDEVPYGGDKLTCEYYENCSGCLM